MEGRGGEGKGGRKEREGGRWKGVREEAPLSWGFDWLEHAHEERDCAAKAPAPRLESRGLGDWALS